MGPPRQVALKLELNWPYRRHVDIFTGTQQFAQENPHWQCHLDEFVEDALPRSRRGRSPYDGVIARANEQLSQLAGKSKIPVVNVWFNSPVREQVPGVFPDFVKIGSLAAEHLLSRGFRRFACLTALRDPAHSLMTGTFRRIVDEAGFPCRVARTSQEFLRNRQTWTAFRDGVQKWISGWTTPIGVFIPFDDSASRHVVQMCQAAGLRVPEDVALVTGVNEPAFGLHPTPSLTGIEVPYDRIGYRAARLLESLMSGQPAPDEPIFVPPTGLVGRQSTDLFAVDDETVNAAMRYIATYVHQPIDVADVAEALCVSRRTLERRFRGAMGRSVAEEIRRLRIARAQRQLVETELPIKQIARDCGFRDSVRMYETFCRFVGMSPSEFRSKDA